MVEINQSPAPLDDALETELQRALKERPSFSIRMRISAGFFVLFALALGVTITAIVILSRIQDKLLFMESAGSYNFEIQQARRFEKNFFLYRTNLDDALLHVQQAQKILEREEGNMTSVVGASQFQTMLGHIRRYGELLDQLYKLDQSRPSDTAPRYEKIEEELRQHGAEMLAWAEHLVAKERESVNTMLLMSQRIPLVFLLILLIVVIYLINFVTRQMLQPLNRLMETTRQISEGDFTPLTPQRRYRDEFTELAMAMNHMMRQLIHRQNLLTRAHKLEAVGTLTAGVAHELNNPINNIMITACMLIEDYQTLSDAERLEMAHDLLNQAERARKTVRNLLEFARESEIETELLQIEDLVEATLQLAHNRIKFTNVKIERHYAADLPPIYGDRQQLNQVFLNIIFNALDAMPEGGTLAISTSHAKEKDFIAVDFSDTGGGIPEHVLPNVFDPFFTSKPMGKGTGLGLSVSLGIVQKHGGEIRVDSQVGKGSTFTIFLPKAKAPAQLPGGTATSDLRA
jgi:two-component system NtrC family sensor kinase